jgi:O-antigen/teichoic acid export membrane protein
MQVRTLSRSRTADVLILSSGSFLTALVSILSGVVLTRLLTQANFGTYRQAGLAMSFAVPLVMMGLDRALFTFLPGEQERPRAVLVENLLLLLAAGGALTLFAMIGGGRLLARRFDNPALAPLLSWFAAYALFYVPATAVSGCLLARQQTRTLAAYNVISRLMNFLAVVSLVWFWRKPAAALVGVLIGTAINCVAGVWLMWRACPGVEWRPSREGMGRQLAFAVPLGLSSLVGSLGQSLDQMVVSLRCTPAQFAVYTVGAMEVPLVGMITGSITSVVMVDYARLYRQGRVGEIVRLVQLAMSRSALILLPAMTLLWVVAPALMRLLYGPSYAGAALPFRIYLLLLPVRTLTFGAVIQTTGSSRPMLVQSIIGLALTATSGWLLAGWLGPAGAAAASVSVTLLFTVPFLLLVLMRRLRQPAVTIFPWAVLARTLAASLVAGSAAYLVTAWGWPGKAATLPLAVAVFVPVVGCLLVRLGVADWAMIRRLLGGFAPCQAGG